MSDELKEEGMKLFRRGLHDEALATFEAAAESYAAAGNAPGRGEMLNNIGVVHRVRQEWPAAIDALNQAEEVFAAAGANDLRAQTLGNLGDVYAYKGEQEQAARHYSQAVEAFAAVGDQEKQSQVLRALSLLRLRQRRVVEALHLMEQSLRVRPSLNPFQRLFRGLLRFALSLLGRGA